MDSTRGHFMTKVAPGKSAELSRGPESFGVHKQRSSALPQDFRAEESAPAGDLARDHEHPLARVVQRLRMLRRGRDMRLHHLKDVEVVLVDEHVVIQPA